MPIFHSHQFPQWDMGPDLAEVVTYPGVSLLGETLGELLEQVFEILGIRIIPADPPKYFKYFSKGEAEKFVLVDIHVERDGIEICPKQDLGFPLLAADIVEAGVLVC